MKYNMTAKTFQAAFIFLLKRFYKENFPTMEMSSIIKDLKREYRAMLQRTDSIGEKNPMESNLIGACFFFSMAKTIPNMTPQLMDYIIDVGIHSSLMEMAHKGKRKKGVLFSEKTQNQKVKEAEESQKATSPLDWKYTYEKGDNEFYCTYTQCGICELAKREKTEEYLPCLCKMDFAKYEMLGGELTRTKTLAKGDECCNFHVVKKGK